MSKKTRKKSITLEQYRYQDLLKKHTELLSKHAELRDEATRRLRNQNELSERVLAAANSVEQSRAYVKKAFSVAVETHQYAESLLIFNELEPLQRMFDRLTQLQSGIEPLCPGEEE